MIVSVFVYVRVFDDCFCFLVFDVVFLCCSRFVCVACLCLFIMLGCCWFVCFVLFLFHYMCSFRMCVDILIAFKKPCL